MTGGVLKNMVVVRAEQGVKARGWDPNGFRGGGGTVGCRLPEIDKGWGVTGTKQGQLSATGPCTASNQQSW